MLESAFHVTWVLALAGISGAFETQPSPLGWLLYLASGVGAFAFFFASPRLDKILLPAVVVISALVFIRVRSGYGSEAWVTAALAGALGAVVGNQSRQWRSGDLQVAERRVAIQRAGLYSLGIFIGISVLANRTLEPPYVLVAAVLLAVAPLFLRSQRA